MKNMPNHRIAFDLNSPFNCSTLRKVRSLLDLLWNEMQKKRKKEVKRPPFLKTGEKGDPQINFPVL